MLALAAGACLWAVPLRAQEVVGRIEGDDIAVKGQVSLVREAGRKSTALASGSEVTVRTGSARLVLADGSEVDVCGPAHFSVLKSGEVITVAVNFGRVHARLSPQVPVTLYTPLVVATPLSVSERPRDIVLGVDSAGGVCAYPVHGAVRLEQQLTGASLVVPQGGEVALPEGQIEALRQAPETCRCNAVLSEDLEPERAKPVPVSVAGLPNPSARKEEEAKIPAKEVPAWQVVMPPLTFDAKSPQPPPEPSPEMIILLRQARVQNGAVLHGRVEEPKSEAAPSPQVQASAQPQKAGFFRRIGGFFKRLFGGGKKGA